MSQKCKEKIKDLEDNQVVNIVRSKNQECYEEIVNRYQEKLLRYLYGLVGNFDDAQELLQNVFIKVYLNLDRFDEERKFSSWIYRIAHNEAVNLIKRKKRKYFMSWEDISTVKDKLETVSQEKDPLENSNQKELARDIKESLNKLPRKYKEVLEMRYFQEKSYDEISQDLDKPVNTVGTLINRAKKKLHSIMAREYDLLSAN